jgi:hypothetical protein
MLLIAQAREYGNVTKLDCWGVGGQHRVVNPPIRPYFYSRARLTGSQPVVRRLLSDVDVPVRNYMQKENLNLYLLRRKRYDTNRKSKRTH